jgi:hypothetical protein
VLAMLGDKMRCVHYDRLTSGCPSGSNGSRFVNDALRVRITSGSPMRRVLPSLCIEEARVSPRCR